MTGTVHPDAALLELGRRLDLAWAAEHAAQSTCSEEDEGDQEFEAFVDATGAIVGEIEALPATTLEGLRVKAVALHWCRGGDLPLSWGAETTDERLAESIVNDLLRLPQA